MSRPINCEWFALCRNPATGTTPHPVLGDVPTCDRCHQFATGETRGHPSVPPQPTAALPGVRS